MQRFLIVLLCVILTAIIPPATAREQSDAPDIEIIGFSADGRYFAYEQHGYDLAAGALDAAIFVVDRKTNKQTSGFPFGFIGIEQDGEYPVRVGGHDIDLEKLKTEDGDPDLAKLRKLVREKVSPKLAALGIGTQGRRLAGVPLTQRSPVDDKTTPLKFVVWPTMSSTIPDQQLVYTIDAKVTDAIEDCVNAGLPKREVPVTFEIIAERTYPETKTMAKKAFPYQMPVAKDACPARIWISDIIAPPGAGGEKPVLMVVFLAGAWSPAVDSAQYHATFIEMPEGK
jgi:hypothetical protein